MISTIRPIPPGPVAHDEDGDPVPQPADASDLADLIQLMEWGRVKGYVIGPSVRVGKLVVQIRDVRQREGARGGGDDPAPSIWEEAGYKP